MPTEALKKPGRMVSEFDALPDAEKEALIRAQREAWAWARACRKLSELVRECFER
mgnify:FL=1